jgi:hypothetical protein
MGMRMLSRRNLLVGSAALLGAAAVPAPKRAGQFVKREGMEFRKGGRGISDRGDECLVRSLSRLRRADGES